MLQGYHHRCLSVVALGAALSLCGVAWAQESVRPMAGDERNARMGADRSLSDAVRHVQRTTGGRILGAERVPYDGRDINRVKYMDDRGRVRYMDAPVRQPAAPDISASPRHGNHL